LKQAVLSLGIRVQQSGLAKTVGWALGSALISQSLNIANSIFLARLLKAVGFGQYNLILVTVAVGSSIGSFGLGVTATRFVASERERGGERLRDLIRYLVGVAFIASLVCAILMVILSDPLSRFIAANTNLVLAFKLSSLYLFGSAIDLVMMGILVGFERFRTLLISGFVKGVLAILFCLFLGRALAVTGAVAGIGLMSLMGAALNGWLIWRSLPSFSQSSTKLDRNEKITILRFSIPIMLASLLINPSAWLGSVFVSRLMGGAVLLAEFAVVRNWMFVLQFFPVQLAQALLPFLSRSFTKTGLANSVAKSSAVLVTMIAIATAIISFPFGLWFIQLYGFTGSSLRISFYLIVMTSVLSALNTILGQISISRGRSGARFFADFIIAASFVVSVYVISTVYQKQHIALALSTFVSLFAGTTFLLIVHNRAGHKRVP
jgi:O-antigen/teichoic acid export membrane protein